MDWICTRGCSEEESWTPEIETHPHIERTHIRIRRQRIEWERRCRDKYFHPPKRNGIGPIYVFLAYISNVIGKSFLLVSPSLSFQFPPTLAIYLFGPIQSHLLGPPFIRPNNIGFRFNILGQFPYLATVTPRLWVNKQRSRDDISIFLRCGWTGGGGAEY